MNPDKPDRTIYINTGLLAPVARWAHTDIAAWKAIGAVAFRPNNTIVATDGHRIVMVPHETHGHSFGVARSHLLAAIAAQNVLARDGIDPPLDHDLVVDSDDNLTVADGPHGRRMLEITVDGDFVRIGLGAIAVRAPLMDISKYPSVEAQFPSGASARSGSPNGYVLNPRYLGAIEEINNATSGWSVGVRVIGWGNLDSNGRRGAVILENAAGVKFAIMPQIDKPTTS